jgi:Retrotransposon gag protein
MSQESSSSSSNAEAPITASQMNQMLSQFARSQQENVNIQVQSALHQFQQSLNSSSAASSVAHNRNQGDRSPPIVVSSIPSHIKLAKPDHYSGLPNTNVDTWLFGIEQYLAGSGITDDAARITLAASYFRDIAGTWWYQKCQIEHNPPTNWVEFKEAVKSRFQPIAAARTARANLRSLRQSGRSIIDYSNAFYKQIQLISDMSEADKVDNFMNGLNPSIANEVDKRDPKSLQEAMTFAQGVELRLRNYRQPNYYNSYHHSNYNRSIPINRTAYESKTTTSTTSAATPMELSNITASNKDETNYEEEYEKYLEAGDAYEMSSTNEEVVEEPEDGNQGEETEEQLQAMYNHNSSNQRFGKPRGRINVPNLRFDEFTRLMKEGKCLRCKRPGHIARNCSLPQRSN